MHRWRVCSYLLMALLLSATAQAQSLSLTMGADRIASKGAPAGPLVGLPTPSGAYSLRKLVTAYAGSPLRLLRASDSAQQDIGFTAGGDFNTATATTFCNATTCTVVKWYDQSGNGRDLTVGTPPSLFLNCINTTVPCARFFGGGTTLSGPSITPATGVVSISVVSRRASGTGSGAVFHENGSGANRIAYPTTAFYNLTGGASGTIQVSQTEGQWHTAMGVMNGASSYLSVDGATTTGTVTGSVAAAGPGLTGGSASNFDSVEAIFWDNYALTAPQAAALNTNQRTYWGF